MPPEEPQSNFARYALIGAVFSIGFALVLVTAWYTKPTRSPSEATLAVLPGTEKPEEFDGKVFSTTTPQRIINTLSIDDVIPEKGKFIVANLVEMKISLYENGSTTAEYPILTKGKPGTPWETPSGFYSVLYKQQELINSWEQVRMPYSMEFYGNYFIHGWPTYLDGTPVASTYSGGCIRLSTEDAEKVYAFAKTGTGVFVYDTGSQISAPSLTLTNPRTPSVSAESYLVADIDTGDVYAEHNASTSRPIASVTKLMTALVASETIMFDRPITIQRGILHPTGFATDTTPVSFLVNDLLYPLLMESNNDVADALARYYGTKPFIGWMNSQAKALGMNESRFADPSGKSPENISTPEDLYRLAVYLATKKSFVWKITRTPSKIIKDTDGGEYTFANFNQFADSPLFVGGKVGHTTPAEDTMVSVFSIPVNGQPRRIAVVVLGSENYTVDTSTLSSWFEQSAANGSSAACAGCAVPKRKLSL